MSSDITIQSSFIEGETVLHRYYFCLGDNDIQNRFLHFLRENDIKMQLVCVHSENFYFIFLFSHAGRQRDKQRLEEKI